MCGLPVAAGYSLHIGGGVGLFARRYDALAPTSPPTPASKPGIDYLALEAEIEKAITTGPRAWTRYGWFG